MILVVNANTNECKIYHYDKQSANLTLIKQMNDPNNKLNNRDLTADKEGHYKSSKTARGAYSPPTEAKEVEIINFAREIANDLNQRRHFNGFDRLILIAAPHMYGLINQHLDKQVISLMTNNLQKDLIFMKDHELLNFLKTNTQFVE